MMRKNLYLSPIMAKPLRDIMRNMRAEDLDFEALLSKFKATW